ncbi:MAG: flavodoxin domain-containing protein [Romboutsia sp.]
MGRKIAVIYKSKYGSTKKYAGWIALRVEADLYEVSDFRPKDFKKYDVIIYGGGIYVGDINGIKIISKNYEKINEKEIIIFTVGMESIKEKSKDILNKYFDEEECKNIKTFNFRGGFDYSNLNIKDKILVKGLKQCISKKSPRELTKDDKIVLEGFEREVDLCDKNSIDLLIKAIG